MLNYGDNSRINAASSALQFPDTVWLYDCNVLLYFPHCRICPVLLDEALGLKARRFWLGVNTSEKVDFHVCEICPYEECVFTTGHMQDVWDVCTTAALHPPCWLPPPLCSPYGCWCVSCSLIAYSKQGLRSFVWRLLATRFENHHCEAYSKEAKRKKELRWQVGCSPIVRNRCQSITFFRKSEFKEIPYVECCLHVSKI